MPNDLVKYLGIGFGVGAGADYAVERFKLPFLNEGMPISYIQILLYSSAILTLVLGFVSKEHHDLMSLGLGILGGTWSYEHYLARYLGLRKLARFGTEGMDMCFSGNMQVPCA